MRIIPIYRKRILGLLLSVCIAVRAAGQATDSLSVCRRIVAAASLAAKEYAIGVVPQGRRVTAPEEVSEARQFLEQAQLDVGSLPVAVRDVAGRDLQALRRMIERIAPPDSVSQAAATLVQRIAARSNSWPPSKRSFSLMRAREVPTVSPDKCSLSAILRVLNPCPINSKIAGSDSPA